MASLAPCLVKLRDEYNATFPGRDTGSDGWIGDAKHASRPSKHNPGPDNLVEALDLDEDTDGVDTDRGKEQWAFVQHLLKLAAEGHPALNGDGAHIIYEGRIWSFKHGWRERPYTGVNAHKRHVHVACVDGAGKRSPKSWRLHELKKQDVSKVKPPTRWLGLSNPTMVGDDVRWLHDGLIVLDPANKARLGPDFSKKRYGVNTSQIVERFRLNRKINERGFGPKSRARMKKDLAARKK